MKNIDNEYISAFAFDTGKKIEELIKDQTDNLDHRNKLLEAKILQWYHNTQDSKFAEHFNITIVKHDPNN